MESYRVGIVKLEAKSKQEREKFYENCLKGIFVFLDIGWNECQWISFFLHFHMMTNELNHTAISMNLDLED